MEAMEFRGDEGPIGPTSSPVSDSADSASLRVCTQCSERRVGFACRNCNLRPIPTESESEDEISDKFYQDYLRRRSDQERREESARRRRQIENQMRFCQQPFTKTQDQTQPIEEIAAQHCRSDSGLDLRQESAFNKLPQELRDMIYENCTVDYVSLTPKTARHIRFHLRHSRATTALLLNKRHRTDYKAMVRQQTRLVFDDCLDFQWAPLALSEKMARQLNKIKHAEFHFDGMCQFRETGHASCDIAADLRGSRVWIQKASHKLPNLKTISIRLGIWWPTNSQREYAWPHSPHDGAVVNAVQEFAQIRKVVKIEAYRKPEFTTDAPMTEDEVHKEMWVSWNKTDGFQSPPLVPGVYCAIGSEVQCRGINCHCPHFPLKN